MADFHFLRPLWLLLLPVGLWLVWRLTRSSVAAGRWQAWVDEALQPFVLTAAERARRGHRWLFRGAAAACALAVVALAGPAWERAPTPTVRSADALVVVLDLSRSMNARDVEPSRLERARLKLLSLLQRRGGGQTGLVVFSAHAFTVTPLTTDTRTIAALVSSLSSDIMPSRGSYPEAGIRRAVQLLRQGAARRGEILLVSDSAVSPAALELARDLRAEGMTLHVMAVGTAQGGPLPQAGGGFLTDARGQVVISRVDPAALQRLADAGGGRFSGLTPDDRDLDRLFPAAPSAAGVLADPDDEQLAEVWLDRGIWLAPLLLPLLALSFRRGWVAVWAVMLMLPGQRSEAFAWADLWQRPDQQGQAAFDAGDHERAGELFGDPAWRAAAQYRAGQFESSAATLEEAHTADGHYNRGNALARAGSIAAAIDAYDQALGIDPEHEDARHNRDLLMQTPPEPPPSDGGGQDESGDGDGEAESGGGGDSQDASSNQGAEPSQSAPDQGAQGAEDPSPGQGVGEDEAPSGQPPGELSAEPPDVPAGDEPLPPPADLEEWASEQAAEQWLRRIPEDPGGLLRRKFLYQYQRFGVDQDGNHVWPGDEAQPW